MREGRKNTHNKSSPSNFTLNSVSRASTEWAQTVAVFLSPPDRGICLKTMPCPCHQQIYIIFISVAMPPPSSPPPLPVLGGLLVEIQQQQSITPPPPPPRPPMARPPPQAHPGRCGNPSPVTFGASSRFLGQFREGKKRWPHGTMGKADGTLLRGPRGGPRSPSALIPKMKMRRVHYRWYNELPDPEGIRRASVTSQA